MHDTHTEQLELFDLSRQPAPRPHHHAVGHWFLRLRHDQLVLAGIGGLLALTVIFACGVERGKQLARTERALLAKEPQTSAPTRNTLGGETPAAADTTGTLAPVTTRDEKKDAPAPAVSPKIKTPKRLAADRSAGDTLQRRGSRYAIQVVTYSKPHLARQELTRLQATGERAFLVMREGRTAVFIGPFESRDNAGQKVASLKTRYRDCFIKTL